MRIQIPTARGGLLSRLYHDSFGQIARTQKVDGRIGAFLVVSAVGMQSVGKVTAILAAHNRRACRWTFLKLKSVSNCQQIQFSVFDMRDRHATKEKFIGSENLVGDSTFGV